MYRKIFRKNNLLLKTIYFVVANLILISIVSCSVGKIGGGSSGKAMTRSLFMQSRYANIELPMQESNQFNKATISEEVTFTNPDNIFEEKEGQENKPKSLNEVQHLREVVVTAKSRFTPEQKGMVNVDFVIRVPKPILSSKWRVTLKPKILHNDSIVELKEVILKGKEFYEMQKKDYKTYDDYVNSIVKKSDYDSVFLDRKGIAKDIEDRQNFFYKEYLSDWKKQKDYETEIAKWEEKQAELVTQQNAYRSKLYHQYARKALEETIKKYSQGKDTTGIFSHYMKQYQNKVKKMPSYWNKRFEAHQKSAPKKTDGSGSLNNIANQVLTKKDSVKISNHRYLFDEIAQNEMKSERKEEVLSKMIPYPYEQNTQLDTIVGTDRSFTYYYKYSYPVSSGLKRLRITMDGKVDAVDRSTYVMGDIDTISYFISSLSQLADTTLTYKVTKLHRDVYNRITAYVKFPSKKSTLDIEYKDNKDQLKKILDTYYTFTKDNVYALDSATLQVSCSLEGAFEDNSVLSQKRAEEIKNYIRRTLGGELDVNNVFKTEYISEDWNTLAKEIQKRSDLKNKGEILNMITNAFNPDACEADIKRLYKADYAIIRDSIYPLLEKVEVEFNMHRTDMTDKTEVRKEYREGYDEGIRLLQEREYWQALEILSNYSDFNLALCLTCLGYNAKAYELLKELPETGNNEYLLAILSARLNKEQEAVEHLMKSFELDGSKIYRAPLDAEVIGLINKHNLVDQIKLLESEQPKDAI